MPLATIKFAPGVNAEITATQGIAQIIDSQLIRFKYAGQEILPEKLGGWTRYYPVSVGSAIRALHAWEGIAEDIYLAAAAENSLNVISEGVGSDITPMTTTNTVAPSISTTNGSTTVVIDDAGITMSPYNSIFISTQVAIGGLVLFGSYQLLSVIDADTYSIISPKAATSTAGPGGTLAEFDTTINSAAVRVTLTNHGLIEGMTFPVLTPTTVGGITLSGVYLVDNVVNANEFDIIAAETATATTSGFLNGGNLEITYYITLPPIQTSSGYGEDGYGVGEYGTGILPSPSTGTPITTTNWTLDNWGGVLIACPANGPIYYWSPYGGLGQASKIVGAPSINGGIFVSQTTQILIAWASSSTEGIHDPLNVNWSDSGNFFNWQVTSQTQAGGYRLSTGSRIVGGAAGPSFNLLWTDVGIWSMDYVGLPEVYGFNILGNNCGMISRHAFATLNSVVYWMGNNQFFALNGETVQTIPCPVWDYVFQDLDQDNVDKITAGSNSLFGEVTFYFPSASGGAGQNDRYVKFNPVLNTWDVGQLNRSAWIDQSPVGRPVGASSAGVIFQHETSPDADGQPLVSSFSTGYYAIADGDDLTFIDWIFPDFTYSLQDDTTSAIIQMSLAFADYPNSNPKLRGPYSVSNQTKFVNTRLRARLMSATFMSNDLGSFWRMGGVKYRSTPDGRR